MRAAIVATSSMNYCFCFPFSFGRNLKGVYEQVNALEVTSFKSISTSTLGNRPYPR